jgi:hypothetical protein
MANSKDLLLLGSEAPALQRLRMRLGTLGYRAIDAKTPERAQIVLQVCRGAIGAAVISPDLPVVDLRRTLRFLQQIAGSLTFLAAGPPPSRSERTRLRVAGVTYALFDPLHDHVLRFQVNRACAGDAVLRRGRRCLRAPTGWDVPVWTPAGRKDAGVYNVSASGAFLATRSTALRGSRIALELPLRGGNVRLRARVVTTNVPGNLAVKVLPTGMGVAFEGGDADVEARLHLYAQERLASLAI